jgi:hypothetical protein
MRSLSSLLVLRESSFADSMFNGKFGRFEVNLEVFESTEAQLHCFEFDSWNRTLCSCVNQHKSRGFMFEHEV